MLIPFSASLAALLLAQAPSPSPKTGPRSSPPVRVKRPCLTAAVLHIGMTAVLPMRLSVEPERECPSEACSILRRAGFPQSRSKPSISASAPHRLRAREQGTVRCDPRPSAWSFTTDADRPGHRPCADRRAQPTWRTSFFESDRYPIGRAGAREASPRLAATPTPWPRRPGDHSGGSSRSRQWSGSDSDSPRGPGSVRPWSRLPGAGQPLSRREMSWYRCPSRRAGSCARH